MFIRFGSVARQRAYFLKDSLTQSALLIGSITSLSRGGAASFFAVVNSSCRWYIRGGQFIEYGDVKYEKVFRTCYADIGHSAA